MSVNFSNAKLSDYFQLSGSSARSEGNFILENDGKGGFILGIDNHHRYIKGVNAQKGLTGSDGDKANNRKLNLGFYKEFSDFVNGSGYRDCVSVQRVLVKAREQLLQAHVEDENAQGEQRDKGLDTPLGRRTVWALKQAFADAVKGECDRVGDSLFSEPTAKIFSRIKTLDLKFLFITYDPKDAYLAFAKDKLGKEEISWTSKTLMATKDGNRRIRTRISDALRTLATDLRQQCAPSDDLEKRIDSLLAKSDDLVSRKNIMEKLTVYEARQLIEEFESAVRDYHLSEKVEEYACDVAAPREEYKQIYNDELARFERLNGEAPVARPVAPPSQAFVDALKGILGKTSLTLNAAQVGQTLVSPLLDYLKTYTGATIGNVAVRTSGNGRLTLTLSDIKADELVEHFVDDKTSDVNAEAGSEAGRAAKMAKDHFGDKKELTIAIEPKVVMKPVEGGGVRPVLQLSLPEDGLASTYSDGSADDNFGSWLGGVLSIAARKFPKGVTPFYSPDKPTDFIRIDIDLANLEKNPLAGLGLSPADLTSLNVGENGVKLGFCEPAANRPANPQPDAAEPRLDSPHSLEADLGVNDLLNNAKAIAKDQLTVAQGKVPRNSPEWRKKENLKGVIDHLGALSLAADQTRGTLELRATDITLGDHLNLLPEDSKAKTAVKWLDPRNLSLKFKPKVEADGKVSLEVTDFTYTSGGLIGGLVAKALKYKAVRQLVWKYFGDRIAGALRGKLGPEASVSLQENGWPKVTLPAVKLTQGVLNGATDFAGRISEIKVTNRGIKIGADVDHAVRNRVVLRVNASEKRRMAEFETITAGENPVIGKKETDELKEIKAVLKKGKADLEKLLEEARKRAIVHPDWPKIGSLADMRVTLKRLEEDLAKIDARLKELHIVLQEEPNPA